MGMNSKAKLMQHYQGQIVSGTMSREEAEEHLRAHPPALTPSQVELAWWREFHSRLVPGTDLPTIGADLGPYNYRVSRAGFQDV